MKRPVDSGHVVLQDDREIGPSVGDSALVAPEPGAHAATGHCQHLDLLRVRQTPHLADLEGRQIQTGPNLADVLLRVGEGHSHSGFLHVTALFVQPQYDRLRDGEHAGERRLNAAPEQQVPRSGLHLDRGNAAREVLRLAQDEQIRQRDGAVWLPSSGDDRPCQTLLRCVVFVLDHLRVVRGGAGMRFVQERPTDRQWRPVRRLLHGRCVYDGCDLRHGSSFRRRQDGGRGLVLRLRRPRADHDGVDDLGRGAGSERFRARLGLGRVDRLGALLGALRR